MYSLYYYKDTTAQSWTKFNEILKLSINDPHLTVCNFIVAFGNATKFSKAVAEP